jgi:hypothetical protein
MRLRITTPMVMKALRKLDPNAARPFNFAISPILTEHIANCTLISKFNKHPETWMTQEYTEIHSGKKVKLNGKFAGRTLKAKTLRNVLRRYFLHPEDKSLLADGQPCRACTRGLLILRPVQAMIPFIFVGKEIERKAQGGEDNSAIDNRGPVTYQAIARGTLTPPILDSLLEQSGFRFAKSCKNRACLNTQSSGFSRAVGCFLRLASA